MIFIYHFHIVLHWWLLNDHVNIGLLTTSHYLNQHPPSSPKYISQGYNGLISLSLDQNGPDSACFGTILLKSIESKSVMTQFTGVNHWLTNSNHITKLYWWWYWWKFWTFVFCPSHFLSQFHDFSYCWWNISHCRSQYSETGINTGQRKWTDISDQSASCCAVHGLCLQGHIRLSAHLTLVVLIFSDNNMKLYKFVFYIILQHPDVTWFWNYLPRNIRIWVRSLNCGCLVTWFCYQLIAKPGNKTTPPQWPDSYPHCIESILWMLMTW